MKVDWKSSFWKVGGVVLDSSIKMVADTLRFVGTASCLAGGAGLSLSTVANETLTGGYDATMYAPGVLQFNLYIPSFGEGINETLPIDFSDAFSNGNQFNSTDYVTPEKINLVSGAMILSGTALRLMGSYLMHWQQYNEDSIDSQADLPKPSPQEMLYIGAESLTGSLTYSLLGTAITGVLVNASEVIGSYYTFSYPATGSSYSNSTYYKGPLINYSRSFHYKESQNVTVDLPHLPYSIVVEESIEGDAVLHAEYGAGGILDSNATERPAVVASGVGAFLAYHMHSFFGNKARRERDNRMRQVEWVLDEEYVINSSYNK